MKVLIVAALAVLMAQLPTTHAQELVSDFTPGVESSDFNGGVRIGDEIFFTSSRYLFRLDSDGLTKVDSSKVDTGESFMRILHQTEDKFWYVKMGPEGMIHNPTGDPLNLLVISKEENQEGVVVDTLNYSDQSRGSYRLGESEFIFGYNRLLRKDLDDLYFFPLRIDDQASGSQSFNEGHWINGKLVVGVSSNGPGNGVGSFHHKFYEVDDSGILRESLNTGTVNNFPFAFFERSLVAAKATSDGDDGFCRSAILRHEVPGVPPDTLFQFEVQGSTCASSNDFVVPKLLGKRRLVVNDLSAYYQFRDQYYFVSDDSVRAIDETQVPAFFENNWFVRSEATGFINGHSYFYLHHFEDINLDGVADAKHLRVFRRREGFSVEEIFSSFSPETRRADFQEHDFIYGSNVFGDPPLVAGAELFLHGHDDLWHLLGDRFRRRTNFRSGNGIVEKILVATEDKLYFAARDTDHGSELWSIDLAMRQVANERVIPEHSLSSVEVYPNPLAKGSDYTIESDGPIASIKIFDSLGRLVNAESVSQKSKVIKSSADLPQGVYFIRLEIRGEQQQAKLVVR